MEIIMAANEKVLQLYVSLNDVHPQIWRRVVVSEKSSLYDLHLILQIAMGWSNSHLHDFQINGKKYSDPHFFEMAEVKPINEKEMTLKKLKLKQGDQFSYTYDYGDDWGHTITVEDISLPKENQVYPLCMDGEYACPLEDCGGPFAYEMFLQALKEGNPEQFDLFMDDDEFFELKEYFDPDVFNKKEVNKNLATEGEILYGDDVERKKANEAHKMFLLEDFVKEINDKYSIVDSNGAVNRFCLDLPIRKDMVVLLTYLLNNKVIGTKATGNFPLKAVKEICLQFDTPISIDHSFVPVRSEDDVFRLQLLHIFANLSGLIVGDNGIQWEVTAMGKAFLEVTPASQVMVLLYNWFINFNWSFLYSLEFADSDEYTKFVVTTMANLINLEVDEFTPVTQFANQLLEDNEQSFINYFNQVTSHLLERYKEFQENNEFIELRTQLIRQTAIEASENMIIFPMLDFGVLEAIPVPDNQEGERERKFASICLTEVGEILLECLWDQFEG
jgi:hypothetical protein